jgi:hypothetical protein
VRRRSKSRRVGCPGTPCFIPQNPGTSRNQRADARKRVDKKIRRSGINTAILMLTWATSSTMSVTRLPSIAKSAFESGV